MLILHFSQDFRKGKPQLGAFSRVLNQTLDNNEHIIFTIGLEDLDFEVLNLNNKPIRVYQIGLSTMNCYSLLYQIYQLPNIVNRMRRRIKELEIRPNFLVGHSQLFNFYVLLVLNCFLAKRTLLVWEFNVIWGFDRIAGLKSHLRSCFQRVSQYMILKAVDGVIFQTHFSKEFIRSKYNIEHKKMVVLENAVKLRDDLNPKVHSTNRKNIFLVYGLFDELNGIRFFIDALTGSPLSEKFSVHFLGHGPLLGKILEFCEKFPQNKYLGVMSKTDTVNTLAKYQFGIIPRINTLGSNLYIPTKIVEMMNEGLVVLVSDVKGLTEVINNGENGFVYKTGDYKALVEKMLYMSALDISDIGKINKSAFQTLKEKFNITSKTIKQGNFFEQVFNNV